MEIKEEKYEIVGVIKKVCVCEHCNQVMQRCGDVIYMSNPPKYEMYCPKCNKHEYVDCDVLNTKIDIRRKVND